MYAEVAWVLISLGTQVQPQIILDPDYLPDYLSVSYDYGVTQPFFSHVLRVCSAAAFKYVFIFFIDTTPRTFFSWNHTVKYHAFATW